MSRPSHRTRWWLWQELHNFFFGVIDELRHPSEVLVYSSLITLFLYIILIFSALGILDWKN
jgi:hypothetical protein